MCGGILGAPGPRWGQGHKSCWELQMEELCARPWAEHLQVFFLTLSTMCIVSLVPRWRMAVLANRDLFEEVQVGG